MRNIKRLFIAINLPQEIKKELAEQEREIKSAFSEEAQGIFKWVKPDNLHITLLFLGDVLIENIPKLIGVIKKATGNWQTFQIKVEKVCYDRMPPRLIWIETEKNKDLECLINQFKQDVIEQGIGRFIDSKPFSSHITLARVKTWQFKRIDPEEIPEIENVLDLQFDVNSIDLMESVLKRQGPQYTILNSFPLI